MDSEYHQLLLWKYQELKSKGLQTGNKPSGVINCKNSYGPFKKSIKAQPSNAKRRWGKRKNDVNVCILHQIERSKSKELTLSIE